MRLLEIFLVLALLPLAARAQASGTPTTTDWRSDFTEIRGLLWDVSTSSGYELQPEALDALSDARERLSRIRSAIEYRRPVMTRTEISNELACLKERLNATRRDNWQDLGRHRRALLLALITMIGDLADTLAPATGK